MRKTVKYPFAAPGNAGSIEWLDAVSCSLCFDFHGMEGEILAARGSRVKPFQVIAVTRNEYLHSPVAGTVAEVGFANGSPGRIVIRSDPDSSTGGNVPRERFDPSADYPEFLRSIGLVGMGGSMFPGRMKALASKKVHTLVINAVECEPGVHIDSALLLNFPDEIKKGAETARDGIGARDIILAVKKSAPLDALRSLYTYPLTLQPDTFPAGSERLILKTMTGRRIPCGAFPSDFGYLVHNVASIRAIGIAVDRGVPVVERPLAVVAPRRGYYRNLMVPIGMPIRDVLKRADAPDDTAAHAIVSSGLMMGRRAAPDDPVTKGTTSIFLLPEKETAGGERPCVRCGACVDACPLNLHPAEMMVRIKASATGDNALRAQVAECFLCGTCAAVCPAAIPLVDYFKEARLWKTACRTP
jgi:electron transport complex protein RnfC